MTLLGTLALAAGALIAGLLIGYAATRARQRRGGGSRTGPTVVDLLMRLVHNSHNGIVVLGPSGDTVVHNPRAAELGLVRNNQADPRARQAAGQVASSEERVEIDLSPLEARGRQPEAVVGEVASLGNGYTVIQAVDHSEAVRLEATRRDFVANVSHELKTPVGAMALLAETLLDAADDPDEVRRFGEKLLHESTRLGALVTELIALSRLQGAEKLPEPTAVEVDAVVNDALSRVSHAAEAEESTVNTDADSGLVVQGDHMLLVTALANLLTNAIAYSPAGSPVSISRRRVDDTVEIGVTDRGIGIAEEDKQRVFERFYRVDKARSRMTGGTGLGLAIVKHVAANHGGEVRLWSRPGTGSTFTLCLPAGQQGEGAGEHPAAQEEDQDTMVQRRSQRGVTGGDGRPNDTGESGSDS
ncbi:sensor histidine kinase [Haloechinothrix aidingensis]